MEIAQFVTLAAALVSVVLSLIVLQKVGKLMTMLRTPVVKKLSPDMNLRPSSRRPINAQEMATRGERKDNRQAKDAQRQNNKETREGQNNAQNMRRDRRRNEQRPPRREVPTIEKQQLPVEEVVKPVQTNSVPEKEQVVSEKEMTRRPLPPRIAPESVPAVPAKEVVAQEPAPAVTEAAAAVAPEKVRYGRRAAVRTAPELEE